MIEKNRLLDNGLCTKYKLVGETFKIPLNKIKLLNSNTFISTNLIGLCDAIDTIQLICDNSKYRVNKIYIHKYQLENITKKTGKINPLDGGHIFEEIEKYELVFDSNDLGYEVFGINKFFIIPTHKIW